MTTLPADAATTHRELFRLSEERRTDEALALIDDAIIDHRGGAEGDVAGADAWRAKLERIYGAQRPFQVTVKASLGDSELSCTRFEVRGENPETGKSFAVTSFDMVRVRDGKVVEHWGLIDQAGIAHQLTSD